MSTTLWLIVQGQRTGSAQRRGIFEHQYCNILLVVLSTYLLYEMCVSVILLNFPANGETFPDAVERMTTF